MGFSRAARPGYKRLLRGLSGARRQRVLTAATIAMQTTSGSSFGRGMLRCRGRSGRRDGAASSAIGTCPGLGACGPRRVRAARGPSNESRAERATQMRSVQRCRRSAPPPRFPAAAGPSQTGQGSGVGTPIGSMIPALLRLVEMIDRRACDLDARIASGQLASRRVQPRLTRSAEPDRREAGLPFATQDMSSKKSVPLRLSRNDAPNSAPAAPCRGRRRSLARLRSRSVLPAGRKSEFGRR